MTITYTELFVVAVVRNEYMAERLYEKCHDFYKINFIRSIHAFEFYLCF